MYKNNDVIIKLIEKEDLEMRVKWINDPEIRSFLMFDWPTSKAKTEKWFNNQLLDDTKKNFTIFTEPNNKPIGMTGLIDINIKNRRAQFYLTIGEKEYWGKKIPDITIPMVLRYGFLELDLNKIYLYTLNNNERARRVYLRNGFKPEGVLKQHYYCVGNYQDLHMYGILREEYLK